MDKVIPENEQNSHRLKLGAKAILLLLLFSGSLFAFRSFISPKAEMNLFHIAEIERGDIQNSLTASGIVLPSFERELNAPVNTEIKEVKLSKGALVTTGDLIMELDQEFTKLEFDKLKDELMLKRNNYDKLKLQFDKDLQDLQYRDQIKALQIQELQTEVDDQARLLEIGGSTKEDLKNAELQLDISRIEKKILENELQFTQATNLTDKEGLDLEYAIQQKRLQELKTKLSETAVKAPNDGVITWINEDIGKTVVQGEPLVRIAKLDHFQIEATSSDRHAAHITTGLPVIVRINKEELQGQIETVLPAVENNSLKFIVALDQPDAEILRPNLRAEVFMITDSKQNVLKIKNGPALAGSRERALFLVEDGQARKITLRKGMSNSDYVEVAGQNLAVGQRIIISRTEDFDHLDSFKIH